MTSTWKAISMAVLLGAGFQRCHSQATPPQPAYPQRLAALTAHREALAARYRQAGTPTEKAAVLQQARLLLVAALDTAVWPAWYGTPWAFYGTTETPRQGHIACGYFVTTTLRDAGLRLNRVELAKTTSEKLIQNLTDESHIRRYRGMGQAAFVQQVRQLGEGLYLVGLDFHVGFLLVQHGQVRFIHSTYLAPGAVVNEPALTARALRSKYRVVGRISADPHLLASWLQQRQFVYPAS